MMSLAFNASEKESCGRNQRARRLKPNRNTLREKIILIGKTEKSKKTTVIILSFHKQMNTALFYFCLSIYA